jgi:hypothetical protein
MYTENHTANCDLKIVIYHSLIVSRKQTVNCIKLKVRWKAGIQQGAVQQGGVPPVAAAWAGVSNGWKKFSNPWKNVGSFFQAVETGPPDSLMRRIGFLSKELDAGSAKDPVPRLY